MLVKDIFSPKKWKLVFIYLLKKFLYFLGDGSRLIPAHEIEQKAFRLAKCYPCFKNGKCYHCGCSTIGLINSATAQCSADKWGVLMSKDDWEIFKESFDLEFNVQIKTKINENN